MRVSIVQPLVPHYRVPLFERLAERFDLTVWAGVRDQGSVRAVRGDLRFKVKVAPVTRMGPFFWQPASLKAASRRNSDVVVLGWNSRYLGLVPAMARARSAGVGTVLWGHGYSKHESSIRQKIRNRIGSLADTVVFYNRQAAERFRERVAPGPEVFFAPNSLDQAPIRRARLDWSSRPADLEEFRRRQGLVPGRTILFVSRLEPDKRVDLLLDAIGILRSWGLEAHLLIVGDGSERTALEERTRQKGLSGLVRFVGSVYGEADIAPWFLSATAFAYPAAIGLSLLHAFGYGVPVVTDDDFKAHNPETAALAPDDNAILFRSGNAEGLAESLRRLLLAPELGRRLGEGGLATVRDGAEFTLDRMVEGIEASVLAAARIAEERNG